MGWKTDGIPTVRGSLAIMWGYPMPRYTSFVLRVWRSSRHGREQWAARLEDLQAGRSEQFTSSDALLAHLRRVLESPDQPKRPRPTG